MLKRISGIYLVAMAVAVAVHTVGAIFERIDPYVDPNS